MNTTVKLLPGNGPSTSRTVRITNLFSDVVIDIDTQGMWLVLPHERKPLSPDKLREVLACYFAKAINRQL